MGRKRPFFVRTEGFTLIELLVVLSFMTLILGALASTLTAGSRVWQRMQCQGVQDESIHLALEEMRRDLHAYHPFEPVPFEGKSDYFVFPSRIAVAQTLGGEEIKEPARIGYYLDRNKGVLCKSAVLYRNMKRQRLRDHCRIVAENIKTLKIKYYAYDKKNASFAWRSVWRGKDVPLAAMLEFQYDDGCTSEGIKKNAQISIPVGSIG